MAAILLAWLSGFLLIAITLFPLSQLVVKTLLFLGYLKHKFFESSPYTFPFKFPKAYLPPLAPARPCGAADSWPWQAYSMTIFIVVITFVLFLLHSLTAKAAPASLRSPAPFHHLKSARHGGGPINPNPNPNCTARHGGGPSLERRSWHVQTRPRPRPRRTEKTGRTESGGRATGATCGAGQRMRSRRVAGHRGAGASHAWGSRWAAEA